MGENDARIMSEQHPKPRKNEPIEPKWHDLLSNGELLQMAIRDPLTGLLNRRAFDEELRWIWKQAKDHPFSIGLLVIDIDHFKAVNDSYGHVVGDQVLKECAALAQASVRESDVVCRYYGGDELVVILPWADEAETRRVANRMIEAFRGAVLCKDTYELRATISVGASTMLAGPGHGAETFLIQADRALYRAKQTGRNKLCFADEVTPLAETEGGGLAAAPAGSVDPKRTVLVVDDDAALCRLFERMIAREGFVVLAAQTAADAEALAERERGMIDVALVDLHIGADNGLDLLKKLRALDESTIGIVITGQATLEDAVTSLQQGAYDFVQKPIAPAQLAATL